MQCKPRLPQGVRGGSGVFIPMILDTLTPKSVRGSCLKVSCKVDSEILSVSFSYHLILKSTGPSQTWNGFSPAHDAIKSFGKHSELRRTTST